MKTYKGNLVVNSKDETFLKTKKEIKVALEDKGDLTITGGSNVINSIVSIQSDSENVLFENEKGKLSITSANF